MIGETLPEYVVKWLWENAFKFPNVIGYSTAWVPKKIDGKFDLNMLGIRFYVRNKFSKKSLNSKDIIPEILKIRKYVKSELFRTDVIELHTVKAMIDKTVNFRPVELGVSVGNEAITAGSLGMLYLNEQIDEILAGSNAHVLTPNAGWSVQQVFDSGKTNILQRGAYHGGYVPKDVVGQYLWHQKISGLGISDCPVSRGSVWLLNTIASLLHRQSRFKTYVQATNSIDFGLYKPSVEHILKIADDSIDPSKMFFGHLYAGSDVSGVLCKVSKIIQQSPYPIRPLNNNWGDVIIGDKVKGCSFWCNYETDVIDTDGVLNVSYGDFIAPMTDAVIVNNDGTIKGGWSGSGWFKV